MAQSVQHLTLGFSSGHDLPVRQFELHTGLRANGAEPTWDPLSLPLSLPLPCSLALKINQSINLKTVFSKRTHNRFVRL